MKTKKDVISVNQIENAIKNEYVPEVEIQYGELTITVKKNLSIGEVFNFVNYVVNTCFDEEQSYIPEGKDAGIRNRVFTHYTNIRLPQSVESQYNIFYHSPIFDMVLGVIDRTQFEMIMRAIDDKINYVTNSSIASVSKQVAELVATIENVKGQFAEFAGNIDKDDLKSLIDAMSSGNFSEENIVKAIMAAKN